MYGSQRVAGMGWLAVSFLGLLLSTNANAAYIYTEDFEDDNIAGAPGFASSVFIHTVAGINSQFNQPAPIALPPSPPDVLFLGAATTDMVTFALNPGEAVESAEVWMTGTGGGWAGVTFVGSLGSRSFITNLPQDSFQLFSVSPGDGIGQIQSVILGDNIPPLSGQEAYYDDLRISVVPEPSVGLLLATIVVGIVATRRARSRNSYSGRC